MSKKLQQLVILVGVDWGSQFHQACILNQEGDRLGEKKFSHSGEGIQGFVDWILDHADGYAEHIGVGIEVPHGPIVEALLGRGIHVFSINPKQSDRFRDRFSPAGSKDDRKDAWVLANALRTDLECFRKLAPAHPKISELRKLSRISDELIRQRTRLVHQVRMELWEYFPQFLELKFELYSPVFLALWKLVLTPKRARRIHLSSVEKILKNHRIRRLNAEEVLTQLRAEAVSADPGTVKGATFCIQVCLQQLKVIQQQISEAKQAMETILDSLNDIPGPATANCTSLNTAPEQETSTDKKALSDVEILSSLPGVGPMVLATIISEGYELLYDRNYRGLRCFCGVAPVTKRSGKSWQVVRRKAYQSRLGNAVYHWSRVAIQHDPISKAKYQALRKRGHTHGRCLRSVGDRLLAVACVMLRDRTLFDPSRRTAAAS